MQVVPLQVMSTFSLLQSTSTVTALVQAAKKQGYQALALTDVDVMYGIVDFYNACRQAQITPILGITLELAGSQLAEQTFKLVVLAKDWAGYQNLMQLSTLKQTAAAETPITLSTILPYLGHLIVMTPAKESELIALLQQDQSSAAIAWLQSLKKNCDPDSL